MATKPRTLAGFYRDGLEQRLRSIKTDLSEQEQSQFVESILRQFDPWPEWVLHVATELFAVRYPRISKKTILSSLKFVHWLAFDMEIIGSEIARGAPPLPQDLETVFDKFCGHLMAHLLKMVFDVEVSKLTCKQVSESRLSENRELKKILETELGELTKFIAQYLKNKTAEAQMKTMETVVDSKRATFDIHGNLRTTSATHIYQAIFKSWPTVESFSGPQELCKFLNPCLGAGDPAQKYDLVKKVCHRMQIRFKRRLSRDKPRG